MERHSDDLERIAAAYDAVCPDRLHGIEPVRFAQWVRWRAMHESRANPGESTPTAQPSRGRELKDWILQEAHYAMERSGFWWDAERRCFQPEHEAGAAYGHLVVWIYRGAVRRAVDFFNDADRHRPFSWHTLAVTMRASLEGYIGGELGDEWGARDVMPARPPVREIGAEASVLGV